MASGGFKFGSSSGGGFGGGSFGAPAAAAAAVAAEHDDDGGDDHDDVADERDCVDDSKLKLPSVALPDKVEVHRDDKDEEEVFKMRSRLFRWDKASQQWKERGTGDLKILRHATYGSRVLMRQEKTMKLVANFAINPVVELSVNPGSDRSWTVIADDYAEESAKVELFAVRFRDAESAGQFKAAYDTAREGNAALHKGGGGGGSGGVAPPALPDKGALPVPVYSTFEDIYGSAELAEYARTRYGAMATAFHNAFGHAPDFFVRAPGRVNLIGEHIDYHGYSVLPMALGHDVVVAAGASAGGAGGKLRVRNMDPRYAAVELTTDPAQSVDLVPGKVDWHQYVQCGYKGAFDFAKETSGAREPVGLDLLVHGAVPAGAGVSSSSALVVAVTAAVCRANGLAPSKAQLAETCRKCEYYIGTMGGGMDQAISCLAMPGEAQHIEFNPVKATPVKLPAGACFVVANSLVEASKAVGPEVGFNMRVTEGKLAAKLIAKKAGVAGWAGVATMKELQVALGLGSAAELTGAVSAHLHEEAYSAEELAGAFGVPLTGLFKGDPKEPGALKVLAVAKSYELARRARHVASEAARVAEFRDVCAEAPSETQLARLGAILNASHASCRDDYACSCPELDVLCAGAVEAGALGARLTGAGWGGCAVLLVREDASDALIASLTGAGGYYAAHAAALAGDFSGAVFASRPFGGAAIYYKP